MRHSCCLVDLSVETLGFLPVCFPIMPELVRHAQAEAIETPLSCSKRLTHCPSPCMSCSSACQLENPMAAPHDSLRAGLLTKIASEGKYALPLAFDHAIGPVLIRACNREQCAMTVNLMGLVASSATAQARTYNVIQCHAVCRLQRICDGHILLVKLAE